MIFFFIFIFASNVCFETKSNCLVLPFLLFRSIRSWNAYEILYSKRKITIIFRSLERKLYQWIYYFFSYGISLQNLKWNWFDVRLVKTDFSCCYFWIMIMVCISWKNVKISITNHGHMILRMDEWGLLTHFVASDCFFVHSSLRIDVCIGISTFYNSWKCSPRNSHILDYRSI